MKAFEKKKRDLLSFIRKPEEKKLILLLVLINSLTWYPVLSFWFFRSWEPLWLIGSCGYEFNLICLMKSHGFLSLLNYKLFGWNPTGWYLTAIILHIVATILTFKFAEVFFRNKWTSFLVALLFSVNITHNDVVNWGSFEGLYALLLVTYLAAAFVYKKFKEDKNDKRWYFLGLLIYLFALFLREVSLILPLLLLSFHLYLENFKLSKKKLKFAAWIFTPYVIISIFYLLFRNYYGGSPNDFVDAMVQLRITLLGQGKYLEYVFRGVIAFGRFAAVHIIPYPLLNVARETISGNFRPSFVNYYFFPLVGFLYFVFISYLTVKFIKAKRKYGKILLFSFLWFVIPTFFYSYAFTINDSAIIKEYVWDASRWRYFAFMGTVFFWAAIASDYLQKSKKKRTKKGLIIFALFIFLINFYLLKIVQKNMYESTFGPARNFYTTFTEEFETLPEDYIFYHYPPSILNDYLAEWYVLRKVYYPYLIEKRNDWAENQMGMLIERIFKDELNIESTYFLDISKTGEVINKTEEAKELLFDTDEERVSPFKNIVGSGFEGKGEKEADLAVKLEDLHVEIPYKISITMRVYPGSLERSGLSNEKAALLRQFASENAELMTESSVSVCATAPSGSMGNPAMNLLPKYLVDGNFGRRSTWVANCRRPSWVILDLGKTSSISGIAFHTNKDNPGTPSNYKIFISNDAGNWREVFSRDLNSESQRIESFDAKQGRYVKFEVLETLRGGFPELDEIGVIRSNASIIKKLYGNDFENMIYDAHKAFPFMRFSWETMPDDGEKQKEIFIPLVDDGLMRTYVVEPNESEVYSAPGDFLKRFINRMELDFSEISTKVFVSTIKVEPRFKI